MEFLHLEKENYLLYYMVNLEYLILMDLNYQIGLYYHLECLIMDFYLYYLDHLMNFEYYMENFDLEISYLNLFDYYKEGFYFEDNLMDLYYYFDINFEDHLDLIYC